MFAESYAKYYDLLNQNKPYKKEIETIYKWAGKPMSIFDIGCGTANYWKYYPPRTFIVGIERSIEMALQVRGHAIMGDISAFNFQRYSDFNCATALFDVINYIPDHKWWKNLPLKKGGFFIFDIWDKEKVEKEGFRSTIRRVEDVTRVITPFGYDRNTVTLKVQITTPDEDDTELHKLYIYSEDDIKKFAGKEFRIVEKKGTKGWQTWYKLVRK